MELYIYPETSGSTAEHKNTMEETNKIVWNYNA